MAGSWNQQENVPEASHPAVCSWRRGAAETRSWLGFIAPPQSQQWKHFYSLLSLQALLQRNSLPLEGFKVSIRGLVRKPLCVFFLDLVCLISVENLLISFEDSVPRVLDISPVWTYLKVHSQVMNASLCINKQWLIWGLYMLCIETSFTEVRFTFQSNDAHATNKTIHFLISHPLLIRRSLRHTSNTEPVHWTLLGAGFQQGHLKAPAKSKYTVSEHSGKNRNRQIVFDS